MAVASAVLQRQAGEHSARRLEGAIANARAATLSEGDGTFFAEFCKSPTGGAFLCMKLEQVSHRLLLTTDTKAGVHLFDCSARSDPLLASWCTSAAPAGSSAASIGLAAGARRITAAYAAITGDSSTVSDASRGGSLYSDVQVPGHSAAVTTCCWYPADCGLFLTGGMDSRIVAWDARAFLPAFAWSVEGPVYCIDMRAMGSTGSASGAAGVASLSTSFGSTATLAAVGSSETGVRLLDLRSCAFAHTLLGHSAAVLTVSWLPSHEFLLASGSRDGTVRLWDVRRSGASAQLAVADRGSFAHADVAAAAADARAHLHGLSLGRIEGTALDGLAGARSSGSGLGLGMGMGMGGSSSGYASTAGGFSSGGSGFGYGRAAFPHSALHTSNPSAASTYTPATAHTGGVNCLVPLDIPGAGFFGGAGEGGGAGEMLSSGGGSTGERSASLRTGALSAPVPPPPVFAAAASTVGGAARGSAAGGGLLSEAESARLLEAALQSGLRPAGAASAGLGSGSSSDAAASTVKRREPMVDGPPLFPSAMRSHLFTSGWDDRAQCWDVVVAAPSGITETGAGTGAEMEGASAVSAAAAAAASAHASSMREDDHRHHHDDGGDGYDSAEAEWLERGRRSESRRPRPAAAPAPARPAGPPVSAPAEGDFASAADVVASIACTPLTFPAVRNQGRRCVYPAVARIGGGMSRPGPHAGPASLAPSAGWRAGKPGPTVHPALPADTVVFVPTTGATAGSSAGDSSAASAGGRRGRGRGAAAVTAEAGGGAGINRLSEPGSILALDAASGRLLTTLRGHQGPVNAVVYREATQELFTAGTDGVILRWRTPLLQGDSPDVRPLDASGPSDGHSDEHAAARGNNGDVAILLVDSD